MKKIKPSTKLEEPTESPTSEEQSFIGQLTDLTGLTGGMTGNVINLVSNVSSIPFKMGKTLLNPKQVRMMEETGAYLRDVRELSGLTIAELNDAMNLKDKSLLEAVENGTATISFELILRLASLISRHDPVTFIMEMTRTYNPAVWEILEDWGMGRLPLQYGRERQFINIYRQHDVARKLSDDGFAEVLKFTQSAFDMALHLVVEKERLHEEE
ncbi:MAG: hypothetical protein B6242_05005 [Anaerolineaceae bacterium 4572_78]|nr:MAG: hypothetical protein B6242_05005 [Anaerolineaceae bacterium 4572_78]